METQTPRSYRSKDEAVDVALLSQALHHAANPARGRRKRPASRWWQVVACSFLIRANTARRWVRAITKLVTARSGSAMELKRMLTDAGLCDARVGVGASKPGDPFTVLIAAATKPGAETRRQRTRSNKEVDSLDADPRSERRTRDEYGHQPYSHPATPALPAHPLVLDGAMGTMIQRHKLTEADFAGLAADHRFDLRGNATCWC